MKKLILLILPLLAITFNSCDKEEDNGNGNGKTKLVKQWIWSDEENTSYTYEYDSQSRITKITYIEMGSSPSVTNITHNGNTITETYGSGTRVFTTNDEGYIIKLEQKTDDPRTTLYTYNTYGELIKTVENGNSDAANTYTWSNGNIIKAKICVGGSSGGNNGTIYDFITTTYTYTDKENKMSIHLYDEDDFYFCNKGMRSKNLIQSSTNGYWIVTYSYKFDNDGYVTEMITTSGNGDETYITTDRFTFY